MNETSDHSKKEKKEQKAEPKRDSGREVHQAMRDRCDAVKRWIDDGDEPAVRGID